MTDTGPYNTDGEVLYIRSDSHFNRRYYAPGLEVCTGVYEPEKVTMHDARPVQDQFQHIDNHGFTLVQHHSGMPAFDEGHLDFLRTNYAREMENLVQQTTACDFVLSWGCNLRQNKEELGRSKQPPARDVHTDYFYGYCPGEARRRYTEATGKTDFPFKRYAFINLWRAVSDAPQDWPLAVVDANTVEDTEGVSNPMLVVNEVPDLSDFSKLEPIPKGTIDGCSFVHNPGHKWYYFSNMNIDEVLVFKLYDSAKDEGLKAWRVPHASFHNTAFKNAVPRESIEVRTICYWK